jgi:uncharacterized membrane protein YkvA (DUF1232 family)
MASFLHKLRLLWQAFFDPRVPFVAKALLVGGLVYGISPLDVVPDFIPILGQLDDVGVLVAVFLFFYRATAKLRAEKR